MYIVREVNGDVEQEVHAQRGWVCPKCSNSVSPSEKTCPTCKINRLGESNDPDKTILNG